MSSEFSWLVSILLVLVVDLLGSWIEFLIFIVTVLHDILFVLQRDAIWLVFVGLIKLLRVLI